MKVRSYNIASHPYANYEQDLIWVNEPFHAASCLSVMADWVFHVNGLWSSLSELPGEYNTLMTPKRGVSSLLYLILEVRFAQMITYSLLKLLNSVET